jgi:hypothetical protein
LYRGFLSAPHIDQVKLLRPSCTRGSPWIAWPGSARPSASQPPQDPAIGSGKPRNGTRNNPAREQGQGDQGRLPILYLYYGPTRPAQGLKAELTRIPCAGIPARNDPPSQVSTRPSTTRKCASRVNERAVPSRRRVHKMNPQQLHGRRSTPSVSRCLGAVCVSRDPWNSSGSAPPQWDRFAWSEGDLDEAASNDRRL